ncbi:MAG: hypothetical protein K9N51_11385, partial [Candidatus Pacebacteria bacterium]|nr:hypothetical protein [Candidatus Paceibacterota bacterium]
MGLCDFDVLTALPELFFASDLLRIRATVGFESRTFFHEYSDKEINSPGEPGVFYFMGVGFAEQPVPDSPPGQVLAGMLDKSHERNRALIDRINSKLSGLAVDYEHDVLPMTPAANATERHIVKAYHDKALEEMGDDRRQAALFWASNLGVASDKVAALSNDTNALVSFLRSKLIKKGGLGYEQPTEHTFPPLDDVIHMILTCGAIPTSTWLDGTSPGESDPDTQLDCLIDKGVAAVNIIPDRNWNIDDADERGRKIRELQRYASTAIAKDLPIIVGTELNKPGQRFVDDFTAEPLKPFAPAFLEGTRVVIGHTRLLHYANFSYTGRQARDAYPQPADRNKAFAAVGALPAPDDNTRQKMTDMLPPKAFDYLQDCAKTGSWS